MHCCTSVVHVTGYLRAVQRLVGRLLSGCAWCLVVPNPVPVRTARRWDTGVGLIALMPRRYMINRRVTDRGDRSDMRDVRYWYGTGTCP